MFILEYCVQNFSNNFYLLFFGLKANISATTATKAPITPAKVIMTFGSAKAGLACVAVGVGFATGSSTILNTAVVRPGTVNAPLAESNFESRARASMEFC